MDVLSCNNLHFPKFLSLDSTSLVTAKCPFGFDKLNQNHKLSSDNPHKPRKAETKRDLVSLS